jgi:uncharacterized protein YqjF (DUF2071 family)
MLVQEWRDVTFLHWAFPPADLRRHVPQGLELDLADGRAWVSLISFSIPSMRPGPLPPVPGLHAGAESHLRTYVVDPTGRRGTWMLGLDVAPAAAAVAGRFPFLLPYWWAGIEVVREPGSVRYAVDRRPPGSSRLRLQVEVGAPRRAGDLDALDRFLTNRWLLFAGIAPVLTGVLTDHPPWKLRAAEVHHLEQTVFTAAGLAGPQAPPLVHSSDGLVARLDRPRLVPSASAT